jgi:hypothetical protein
MSGKDRHVVPRGKQWAVVAPGAKRASAITPTQGKGEARAKDIVANGGGGEVRIHRPNGKIRDSDTVKPGNDPCPPKDKKR